MRADGTPRPSFRAVQAVLAKTAGKCAGKMRSWHHSTAVDGASARFFRARRLPSRIRSWSFVAVAGENASFEASIYRLRHGRRGARKLSEAGHIEANVARMVRFPKRRLAPGRYVYSIRFRADANPQRTTRKTSRPFVVYRAR